MADRNELVPIVDRTGEVTRSEVYLVEAQTLDGCSGAPVFLHETVFLENFPAGPHGGKPIAFRSVRLIGIYSGSWDGEPSKLLAEDRRLGPNRRVPVGIGTVVPIDLLVKAIEEDEVMKKTRREFLAKREKENAATQDSSFPPPVPATDENPSHREDFMSLVHAAVKKPGPKSGT